MEQDTSGATSSASRAQEIKPDEQKEPFPWTLEVALSGGGLRASAFCLGALLYLVHAGINAKVQNIASVSGGSITNGFIACQCDYGKVRIEGFKKIARELARRIAFYGMERSLPVWLYAVSLGGLSLWLLGLVLGFLSTPSAGLLFVAGVALALLVRFYGTVLGVMLLSVLWTTCTAPVLYLQWSGSLAQSEASRLLLGTGIALALLFLVLLRGAPITQWMAATFISDIVKIPRFEHLSGRMVDHVFCATDLVTACPFFFSTKGGGRLLSEEHGRADAARVPIHVAVRASASFPPFIPPLWFDVPANWTDFYTPSHVRMAPRWLWLTDGGAFNNLGTDWRRIRRHVRDQEWCHWFLQRRLTAEDDVGGTHDEVWARNADGARFGQVQLVVDASQPGTWKALLGLHIPILAFFTNVIRTLDVMYGSTLQARTADAPWIAIGLMKSNPEQWGLDDQCKQDGLEYKTSAEGGNVRDDYERYLFSDLFSPYKPALQLFSPYMSICRPGRSSEMGEMMRLWGNVEPDTERRIKRVIEYQKSIYQAEQRFAELWPGSTWDWSKLPWVASSPEALSRLSEERGRIRKPVSTTFRGLGRNRTLCLIVHGYLMTRESLMAAFPRYQPPPIPDKMWFQELLP